MNHRQVFSLLSALIATTTAQAEFKKLTTSHQEPCSISLSEAESIGLTPNCIATVSEDPPLDFWRSRLSFTLGLLTEEQFFALRSRYSGWSAQPSRVKYSTTRSYQLMDFLPPLIQALEGHRFIPEVGMAPPRFWDLAGASQPENTDETFSLYTNCWGIAYEVLRGSATGPTLFMARSHTMLRTLRERSHFISVATEPTEFPLPQSMQPGDFVLIHHTNNGVEYLDHVAIVIDDGIYFEKAGIGEWVPIRVIDEETLAQSWMPGVFSWEIRRPNRSARWPHPHAQFGLWSPDTLATFPRFAELPAHLARNISMD